MTAAKLPRPRSTSDLLPSEKQFIAELQHLEFGCFESLQIKQGELTLNPWPRAVRFVMFGGEAVRDSGQPQDFDLKKPVADFLEYVRTVDDGEIRQLKVRRGLPVSMELIQARTGPRQGCAQNGLSSCIP
jgi:hypothetical protein